MYLALDFSRKYKWPEFYFFIWKILITNQFLVSAICFTNINISFFDLWSDLLSIIAKNVLCCVLTTGRCSVFQYTSVTKKNRYFTAYISRLCYFLWQWSNIYPFIHRCVLLLIPNQIIFFAASFVDKMLSLVLK